MRSAITFIAACLACMMATAQTQESKSGILSAAGGRFVFGQVSEYRKDQYLLDTATGRLWLVVCVVVNKDDKNKCDLTALSAVYFTDSKGDLAETTPPPTKK